MIKSSNVVNDQSTSNGTITPTMQSQDPNPSSPSPARRSIRAIAAAKVRANAAAKAAANEAKTANLQAEAGAERGSDAGNEDEYQNEDAAKAKADADALDNASIYSFFTEEEKHKAIAEVEARIATLEAEVAASTESKRTKAAAEELAEMEEAAAILTTLRNAPVSREEIEGFGMIDSNEEIELDEPPAKEAKLALTEVDDADEPKRKKVKFNIDPEITPAGPISRKRKRDINLESDDKETAEPTVKKAKPAFKTPEPAANGPGPNQNRQPKKALISSVTRAAVRDENGRVVKDRVVASPDDDRR